MTSGPPPGTPLCALDALQATGAKGVLVTANGARYDLFIIATPQGPLGYINACPHRGTPLETFDDRFWDTARETIVCSTHGARFRPSDGLCLSGPCRGKMLAPIPLVLKNGEIFAA